MIGKRHSWQDLTERFRRVRIEPGVTVNVLELQALIEIKEELGLPRDLAVLPVLRQALRESPGRQES